MDAPYLLLVVDDEPDMHTLTQLSLRQFEFAGRRLEIAFVASGAEAVDFMREHPHTAVILLDVVMESASAGLEACQRIRAQGHDQVRILLRTGQPGVAPEKQVIDTYDIDGYLAKAEMTRTRLYTAVRTAIRTHAELLRAHQLQMVLDYLHTAVAGLLPTAPPEQKLQRILEAALRIGGCQLAVLYLENADPSVTPQVLFSYADGEEAHMAEIAAGIVSQVNTDSPPLSDHLIPWQGGSLMPLHLHANTGQGWIYLDIAPQARAWLPKVMPMLAAHAGNALFSR